MPLSRESTVDFDDLLRLPHSCSNSWIPQVHHYAHKSAALDLMRSRWITLHIKFQTAEHSRYSDCYKLNYTGFELRQEQWIPSSPKRPDELRWHGCLSFVSVLCCQVEVSMSGWSLIQRDPTECRVSEYDREASIMRWPWPTRGCSNDRRPHCDCGCLKQLQNVATTWRFSDRPSCFDEADWI